MSWSSRSKASACSGTGSRDLGRRRPRGRARARRRRASHAGDLARGRSASTSCSSPSACSAPVRSSSAARTTRSPRCRRARRVARVLVGQPRAGGRARSAAARARRDDPDADGRAAVEGGRDARLRRRDRDLRPLHARIATRSAQALAARARRSSSSRRTTIRSSWPAQGTAALELLEDAGVVDTLVAPVGGGGLIAGSATIARGPRRAARRRRRARGGRRLAAVARRAASACAIDVPRTIADGLQTHDARASSPGRSARGSSTRS